MSFLNFEMGKLIFFTPSRSKFLDCRANFNTLVDTPLILHYIVAPRFKKKSDHMLILDHTFIDFAKIVHPPCLFRTTLLFGPLEYLALCQFTKHKKFPSMKYNST